MSFGYSVGDFVTVSQLAWKVYAQYRDAPKQFRDVASEVRSLHAVLKQTEAFLAGNAAAAAAAGGADGGGGDLRIILDGCREVFTEAQALLQKFESLGTGRKKARDRLKWTQSEIAELRSRIVSNVGLLTAFKAGLLGELDDSIGKKQDVILKELRAGRRSRRRSIVTTVTAADSSIDDGGSGLVRPNTPSGSGLGNRRDSINSWLQRVKPASIFGGSDHLSDLSDDEGSIMAQAGSIHIPHSNARPNPPAVRRRRLDQPAVIKPPPIQRRLIPRKFQKLFLSSDATTLFLLAAQVDDVPTVQRLVGKGVNIDFCPGNGGTALMAAARAGSHNVLQWLLNNGADKELTTLDGMNALHFACANGKQHAAQVLLTSAANVMARTTDLLQTPLHLAVASGDLGTVRLLVEHGASINAVDSHGWTALTSAINKRDLPIAAYLLERGTHILTDDLHQAAGIGDLDLVVLLLDHGADVSAIGNGKPPENSVSGTEPVTQQQPGFTALHVASRDGNVQVAKVLLDRGADPTATTGSGHTPLHFACFAGSTDLVRLLLGRGVEIEAKANDGATALHIAARHPTSTALIPLLLHRGADVSALTNRRQTALHELLSNPRNDIATLVSPVLEHGVDVNANMHGQVTALHLAAKNSDEAAVKLLLSRGADVNSQSDEGRTPLHYAIGGEESTRLERVQSLLEHGADVAAKDNLGKTAMDYAEELGDLGVRDAIESTNRRQHVSP